jgi:anti-sigma regulatory factor (Ser/Thr protein kinase)
MGQLRTALRGYALEGHSPGRTLDLVDRFAQTMDQMAMATAVYCVFDSESGMLRLASAGHLPPIVFSASGARVLEVDPTPPLGAFPYGTCGEREYSLAAGETIVLYTDGLVERRGVPLSDGIHELMRVAREATTAEEVCLLAVDQLVPIEGLRDDVAIVALQNLGVPVELRLSFAAEPRVLSRVRRVVRRWLQDRCAGSEQLADITIAVNEACANSIEHAYSPGPAAFELEASASDDEIVITVRDSGSWRAPRGKDRGRGLAIIEAAMDAVEVKPTEAGTEISMRRRLARP